MKVSAISQNLNEESFRRNHFIEMNNKYMSHSELPEPIEPDQKSKKLGIENLQEFTIFPKEVIDGHKVITA